MTYSNLKPLSPEAHTQLAEWVKKGGVLVYCGRDDDPFQTVSEWWNSGGNAYAAPADHLFAQMDIPAAAPRGEYACGKGTVCILRADPKEFVLAKGGDEPLIRTVKSLYEGKAKAGELIFKNNFYLRRGVYDLVAVLDESVGDAPYTLRGTLVDLYDPELPVCTERTIRPGEQGLFVNVGRVAQKRRPQVLAAACRAYDEKVTGHSYAFVAKSPAETTCVARVLLPKQPRSVKVGGREVFAPAEWDAASRTYRLRFENDPDGVAVEIGW